MTDEMQKELMEVIKPNAPSTDKLVLFPITPQLSSWYSWIGLTGLALLLAFALYAFHTSFGGRPIFGIPRLDE